MARFFRCDKCGRESNRELSQVIYQDHHMTTLTLQKELCPKCLHDLNKWMELDPVVIDKTEK